MNVHQAITKVQVEFVQGLNNQRRRGIAFNKQNIGMGQVAVKDLKNVNELAVAGGRTILVVANHPEVIHNLIQLKPAKVSQVVGGKKIPASANLVGLVGADQIPILQNRNVKIEVAYGKITTADVKVLLVQEDRRIQEEVQAALLEAASRWRRVSGSQAVVGKTTAVNVNQFTVSQPKNPTS